MDDNKDKSRIKEESQNLQAVQEDSAPSLSMDFYLQLLGEPPCKKDGQCIGCGRCHFD